MNLPQPEGGRDDGKIDISDTISKINLESKTICLIFIIDQCLEYNRVTELTDMELLCIT